MSISGALSNAMSGLRAAGRGAEVVSSNISNALTPGYGRRILELSTSLSGTFGGVQMVGINRVVDAGLAADKRIAQAEQASATAISTFHAKLEDTFNATGDASTISARVSGLENALTLAASRPDAPDRLTTATLAAGDLAQGLNDATKEVQSARNQADAAIHVHVETLNSALQRMQSLNTQITSATVQGGETAALEDQRQLVLDQIGELVPVRVMPRDHGQVALYSAGGAVLLDGSPAIVGFERSNTVTPTMTQSGGQLSGLTLNGRAVQTGSDGGALAGGVLNAQFVIRDELAPDAQAKLDFIARDLIQRFEDPSADPTLLSGDPGLFTDSGSAYDPLKLGGVAGRIELNATVDPTSGGQAWRLRDGVNAAIQGNVGDATTLISRANALEQQKSMPDVFGGTSFSASTLVATIASDFGVSRSAAEQTLSYAAARLGALTEMQLAEGVNTDDEIQRLMVIEQAYAANARVIEAVDEMMQTILRI